MTSVFLAGPMRNYLNNNASAFKAAAQQLRAKSFTVFSPIEWDTDHGFDPRGYGTDEEWAVRRFNFGVALAQSLEWLSTTANAVALLPRWEKSEGSQIIARVGWRLGLPVHSVANLVAFGMEAPQVKRPVW